MATTPVRTRLWGAFWGALLLAAQWWAWATGSGALLLLVPVGLVALIAQTVSPALPRAAGRLALLPIAFWLTWGLLGLGQYLVAVSSVPLGVWVLGLVLLPVLAGLAGLVGVWAAGALWLCCLSYLAARLLGRVLPLDTLQTTLFVLAWVLSGLAAVVRLVLWRAPPTPEAAATPAFDLTAHLDSPDAQEGADKYTRE